MNNADEIQPMLLANHLLLALFKKSICKLYKFLQVYLNPWIWFSGTISLELDFEQNVNECKFLLFVFQKKLNVFFNDVFIFMCYKTEFLLSGLLCMTKIKIIKNEIKLVLFLHYGLIF